MVKKIIYPSQDPETGEWRYKGQWHDAYPSDEVEHDEGMLDRYYDDEFTRRREEPND